ncbi:MAG: hypothetical protein H6737_08095 [Alphaproteobacteria bacterium]|nr:hypothetical protein [Alphaproteobacteria bacterium]
MSNGSDQARTTTVSEVLDRSKKPASSRGTGLSGLAGKLGNDELMARLEQGNGSRDDLLELLASRLDTMRQAQEAEVELTKRMDNHFRTALGESHNRGNEPQPKRWIEAARLYEAAAKALCSGQLQKGNALVEQASKADKKAFDEVQGLVEYDKRLEDSSAEQAAAAMPQISGDVACTDCPLPEGIARLAHEIQEVTNTGLSAIKGERRELDPWWGEEEEEEEEGAEGGGGGG